MMIAIELIRRMLSESTGQRGEEAYAFELELFLAEQFDYIEPCRSEVTITTASITPESSRTLPSSRASG